MRFASGAVAALLMAALSADVAWAQAAVRAGSRVVTLHGFGDYYRRGADGRVEAVSPARLDLEIVATVDRVEGDRVWLRPTGATSAAGWVPDVEAVPLADAVPYFTTRIGRNPKDWDSLLRRAEAALALGRLGLALADYEQAIALAPGQPMLYLRRGRLLSTTNDCRGAAADFERAFVLRADWPEPSNQAARILADCSDPEGRDPKKAIALALQALDLDLGHPPYLTTLALAYFRDGQIDKAVATQRQALEHPLFPNDRRAEGEAELRLYQDAAGAPR
jgi:hypothetical protein